MRSSWRWVLLIWLAVCGVRAGAQAQPAYSLFHPVPHDRLREMSTDRPDQTESPRTVDAGHVQVEMDIGRAAFDTEFSADADLHSALWGVVPLNAKVGLLNRVDIQFVLDTYLHSRVTDRLTGRVASAAGFGDFATRLKINLWGNDGGRTAFGIMPFVKWPLARSGLRNGKTEGGLILPFGIDLGRGWDLGAMTEVDLVARDTRGYGADFINSVTIGREITRKLSVYGEYFALAGASQGSHWQGQADAGGTYSLRPNVQLDAGCNFGVTRSAPDFSPFVGLSFRF